jgi:adenylate cyclase
MVRLVIHRFDGKEDIFAPLEGEIFIGRNDPETGLVNHIDLPDSTASRRHAKIFLENFAFYIEDLSSANGTWVNERQITKAKLTPGDKITIGRNALIFESEGTRTINPLDFMAKDAYLDHHKTIDSNYVILQQLSKLLVAKTSLTDFLQGVIEMIMESIKSTRGVLMLTDPEGNPKHFVTSGDDAVFSEEVVQQVVAHKKSLLVGYDFEASKTMVLRGVHSAICAPLLKEPQLLGVIYLEDPLPGRFGDEELIILTLFANQVAAGIDNVTLSENLQKELKVRSNLERFLSPRVVELVTKDCLNKGEIFLETERVVASILFSDIKGFTMLSERLDPQEVADLLNKHFAFMTELIFDNEGTLDKYVGDGLVAIFGVPFPFPDHAARAVKTGIEMLERQKSFATALPPEKRFSIRIGINTGEIVAGFMGSPKRMEYTVLGEAVIVAERLQALADPGTIYLGKGTYEAVKDLYSAEFVMKTETPKGRKEIEIYRFPRPK